MGADRPQINSLLRQLPAMTHLMAEPRLQHVLEAIGHQPTKQLIQRAIDETRESLLKQPTSDEQCTPPELTQECVRRTLELYQTQQLSGLGQVINATGILLHTNLGRAPLAEAAIERMRQVAGYANVELDLASGRRSKRGHRICELLAELTGAEAAIVVNNCAAATMLALAATAQQREVIVSRGQLVEIGGGFRLPDVFRAAGVLLHEVGTTNRTYARDYENALSDATGGILRVHRSNFAQSGFVCEPDIAELVQLKVAPNIPIIDDVGSGCLYDLGSLGFDEPNVLVSVRAGADLVLFSGDKLFGGPQCGIIVGKQPWIEVLSQHPMMRAMRVDKATLAALEATTEIHLAGTADDKLPLYRALRASSKSLAGTGQTIVAKLPATQNLSARVVPSHAQVGGGTLPGTSLESQAIELRIPDAAVDAQNGIQEIARILRGGSPPVQGYIKENRLLLDLRSVLPAEVPMLTDRLVALFASKSLRGE